MAAIIQLALFSRQHWAAKLELVLNSHRKEAVGGPHTVQAGGCTKLHKIAQFFGDKTESHVLACFCAERLLKGHSPQIVALSNVSQSPLLP